MGEIRTLTIACTPAVGGDGEATKTVVSSTPIEGTIRAIYLEYLDTSPATADVTIVEAYNTPAMDIFSEPNSSTSGWHYPMAQAENQASTAITNQGTPIVVNGYISVTIDDVNAGDGVNVTIRYER